MGDSTSRSVSIRADQNYKKALAIYAKAEGISVAQIVRESVDALHGKGISKVLTSFFASDASCGNHSETVVNDASAS